MGNIFTGVTVVGNKEGNKEGDVNINGQKYGDGHGISITDEAGRHGKLFVTIDNVVQNGGLKLKKIIDDEQARKNEGEKWEHPKASGVG